MLLEEVKLKQYFMLNEKLFFKHSETAYICLSDNKPNFMSVSAVRKQVNKKNPIIPCQVSWENAHPQANCQILSLKQVIESYGVGTFFTYLPQKTKVKPGEPRLYLVVKGPSGSSVCRLTHWKETGSDASKTLGDNFHVNVVPVVRFTAK